jgi:hypothetical protein
MMYAGPLVIALGVAVLCTIALAVTTEKLWVRAFRLGPILLVPLVILWAVISGVTCLEGECQDLWRTVPLYGALALAVLWHVVLIATERQRKFYLAYAGFHLSAFWLLWGFAMALATNFPL